MTKTKEPKVYAPKNKAQLDEIKKEIETPAEQVTKFSGTPVPSGEALAKTLADVETTIDSKLASSQTVAPEFKTDASTVTRVFKGDKINVYTSCKHQYRVERTNGKRDEMSIINCARAFDIPEAEAEDLLGGKFAIELDEKAMTLEYNYTPRKKD